MPKSKENKTKKISSEEKGILGMGEKSTFMTLFLVLAIILVMLPFLTTFNEFLTKIVEKLHLYMVIQNYIVPLEAKMIGAILLPFKIDFIAHYQGFTINGVYMELTWNCIGWQSLILLLVTLLVGLLGPYTFSSKIDCLLIGILGTFLINILRITVSALIGAFLGKLFAVIFHDYASTFIILIWLFFFWWLSYRYILEYKTSNFKSKI